MEQALVEAEAVPLSLALPPDEQLSQGLLTGVEALMKSVDLVVLCTRELFPHAPRRAAAHAGARVLSLGTVSDEMALRALDVDHEALAEDTRALAELVARASEIAFATERGTAIRMQVAGQPVHAIDGLAREPGSTTALPAGVVAALPRPATAEGEVVLDGSIHSLGLLSEPVTLLVKGGRIAEIHGGEQAAALRETLEAADEYAACICEVGFGTNPKATYVGNLVEDERVRGSGHIGIGGNTRLGGTIESSVHIDASVRRPSISLDGEPIILEGEIVPLAKRN